MRTARFFECLCEILIVAAVAALLFVVCKWFPPLWNWGNNTLVHLTQSITPPTASGSIYVVAIHKGDLTQKDGIINPRLPASLYKRILDITSEFSRAQIIMQESFLTQRDWRILQPAMSKNMRLFLPMGLSFNNQIYDGMHVNDMDMPEIFIDQTTPPLHFRSANAISYVPPKWATASCCEIGHTRVNHSIALFYNYKGRAVASIALLPLIEQCKNGKIPVTLVRRRLRSAAAVVVQDHEFPTDENGNMKVVLLPPQRFQVIPLKTFIAANTSSPRHIASDEDAKQIGIWQKRLQRDKDERITFIIGYDTNVVSKPQQTSIGPMQGLYILANAINTITRDLSMPRMPFNSQVIFAIGLSVLIVMTVVFVKKFIRSDVCCFSLGVVVGSTPPVILSTMMRTEVCFPCFVASAFTCSYLVTRRTLGFEVGLTKVRRGAIIIAGLAIGATYLELKLVATVLLILLALLPFFRENGRPAK